MKLEPGHIVDLVESWLPAPSSEVSETLRDLRKRAPSFVPTWLSAVATRTTLPDHLAHEIDEARRRTQLLRTVRDTVVEVVPGAYAIKGHAVADRYPSPLVRTMMDLDLVVTDVDSLWLIAEVLRDQWKAAVQAVIRYPARAGGAFGEHCVIATVVAARDGEFELPLAIDLYTHGFAGDIGTVPARREIGRAPVLGTAEHLTSIAAEGLEGGFSPKDMVDAAVLLLGTDAEKEFRLAREYACELKLVPELARLLTLARVHGLPLPSFAVVPDREAREGRFRRVAAHLLNSAHYPRTALLQALQRSEVFPGPWAKIRRRAWRLVDDVLPVSARVRTQLLGFGVPVRRTGSYDGQLLSGAGREFLLVNSAQVKERWLDPALEFLE
ncbi:hypothetical protein SAMN05421854_114190 [Amycolatopsis rubida]|uniref:Nucleotidyltransferase family protein n=1 Tax=Amycolatopsis rubida TaxID=112413 RepID=A0A1I5ZC22_9PSEU|nr:hypothetical protein SAMN05421854_114190 [Amycolatopsis rubida]